MCSTKFIAWTHTCMNMVPSVSQWELPSLQIHLLGLPSGRQNTACIQEWWYLPIHCKLSHQALKQLSEIQNNAHEKQQLTTFLITLEEIDTFFRLSRLLCCYVYMHVHSIYSKAVLFFNR